DVTLLPRWHHFFARVVLEDPETALHPGHGHYVPAGWTALVHARTAGPFTTSVGERSVVIRQPQPGRGEQIFSWWVAPGDEGTRIIQRVRVAGRYGVLFARLVGRTSASGFAEDVRRLARLVDSPGGAA
ncbi:MAG: hypothetical protein Q4F67_08950, partial [Propionibacteriaceae bacterium]|nr:hypothetical protein [Propionibacteriaceae bacterium]